MSGADDEAAVQERPAAAVLSTTPSPSAEAGVPALMLHESQEIAPASEGEEDEFDEGYEVWSSSESISATSSALANTYEHGRRYCCSKFSQHEYPIPNDDTEQAREDLKHEMLLQLMDGQLFIAPIGENPTEILDIGTGTGIWALDVGDKYPGAKVRGIDLSPIQPEWMPPNVDFLVDDCEVDWPDYYKPDLIHLRFMVPVLRNVPAVLKEAYRSLKPGGWIELQELSATPMCDDDTMADDDSVKKIYNTARKAFAKFDMDITLPERLEPLLLAAGFENISCTVQKVPIGGWAKDKHLRQIGNFQRVAVEDMMSALPGRPFTALGMSEAESQVILAYARDGLKDYRVHRYFKYYFWCAQKPEP